MKAFSLKFRRFCAVLIGLVFLASGLLKLLDPVGTGLVVAEYAKFLRLGFIGGISRATGVVLALLESVLGAALVTGVFRRLSAALTWLLLAFFTLVTVLLVILNPEMDCGCFGEAVHLTHFQSLLKNLILLALAAVAFLPWRESGRPAKRKYASFGLVAAFFVFAAVYNARHLPVVDFTDFAPGSELLASQDGTSEEPDVFEALIYERGGQRGLFSANRLPDSTWTFVGVDTVSRNTLRLDASAPVLSFRDAEGEYRDAEAVRGKVLLVSVYDPESFDWDALPAFQEQVYGAGVRPILLTTDAEKVPAGLEAYVSDFKTLITLNRANGGATYVDDGLIVRKWHVREWPSEGDLSYFAGLDAIDGAVRTVNEGRLRAQGCLLYVLALLLLL